MFNQNKECMKRLSLILVSVAIVVSGFFTSCTEDEPLEALVDIKSSTDTTVMAGASFTISWDARKGDDKMKFVSISKNGAYITGWNKKEIPSASSEQYIDKATITADPNPGVYEYIISVFDSDDKELGSAKVKVTVVAAGEISSYTAKLMGAQDNSNGSFFASITGSVYKTAELTTNNRPTVDITYGVHSSQSKVISASAREGLGFSAFTGATETKYVSTNLDFAAVSNDTNIKDISFTTGATSIVVELNKVYAFKNAAGKIGVFKVTNLVAGAAGSITIDVKVQK